jgi:hypothetical protein
MKIKKSVPLGLFTDFNKKLTLIAFMICLVASQLLGECSAASLQKPSFTPESIRLHHQALVDIASEAGGLNMGIRLNEAGKKAADYIFAEYKKAGLQNVRFEEFYPNRWWPENYSVTVLGEKNMPDEKLNAFPLWDCEGAKDLVSEVVYAGFGTSGEYRGLDVKGKTVLIDMKRILHFIPSFQYTGAIENAREKGAVAVIIAETRIESPSGSRLGSSGGIKNLGSSGAIKNQRGQAPKLFPLPVFSVGKSDGENLKKRLSNSHVKVRINLDYSLTPGRAVNIIGELPGNGSIDEYIIVGGHYDSWFNGAIDNLGSQASIIAMAKHYASIPQVKRNRHILFVSIFGHEFGNEEMGHAAFIERRANILDKVTCFLNIDGSGSSGWEEKDDTDTILPTGMDDKAGIFTTSWALTSLARKAVYPYAKGPWGQYPLNSFVADLGGPMSEAGFPILLLISKNIYYHSMLDTIDRITPDQVYRRSLMNVDIINGLLDSPKGYYISVNTNPNRKLKEGEKPKVDLEVEDMPENPTPWIKDGPRDLSFHVIPSKPRVFSPVIVWPAFWNSGDIIFPDSISWNFGIPGSNTEKIATGTFFILPGKKNINMTVTDIKGRKTTITREIEVTW